ncbi:MAG: DUF3307 domain-containing protein [Culicoidibacterales bacterium]
MMTLIYYVIALIICFQIKHFLCDFPLQTKYMLGKFDDDGWFEPLFAHAAVHALFTYTILFVFMTIFKLCFCAGIHIVLALALFDLVVHFLIDLIKIRVNKYYEQKPSDKHFWTMIGVDQLLHHLTHYTIIVAFVYTCINT